MAPSRHAIPIDRSFPNPRCPHLVGLGLIGGTLGGLGGFSGAIPALYAQALRWPKAQQRPLFQCFNMSILGLAVVGQAISGLIGPALILASVMALPTTLIGTAFGRWLYHYVDEDAFRRIILAVLAISGARLLLSAV